MSPPGLHNGVVDALIKSSPQVLFLLFGRRSILSSATMWQSILYPPIFTRAIDLGLNFLFGWKTKNMSTSQKLAAYPHLYSFTSTKSVVHWFQIIRNKSFQMYDDDVQAPLSLSSSSKYTKVARYPTRNIKAPIVLVYGGSDSLVDIKVMLRELPKQTVATEIPHYEHLDFLWARDVHTQVFPHVFDALECFTNPDHTEEEYERYRNARARSVTLSARNSFKLRDTIGSDNDVAESDTSTVLGGSSSTTGDEIPLGGEALGVRSLHLDGLNRSAITATAVRDSMIPTPTSPSLARPRSSRGTAGDIDAGRFPPNPDSPSPTTVRFADEMFDSPSGTHGASEQKDHDIENALGPGTNGVRRSPSGGSLLSMESTRAGRGITIGASRSVGGVTTAAAEGARFTSSSDEGRGRGSAGR